MQMQECSPSCEILVTSKLAARLIVHNLDGTTGLCLARRRLYACATDREDLGRKWNREGYELWDRSLGQCRVHRHMKALSFFNVHARGAVFARAYNTSIDCLVILLEPRNPWSGLPKRLQDRARAWMVLGGFNSLAIV